MVVKLDQYAGNVDEIVCVALTGNGADRYGANQARNVFDAMVKPLLENPDDEYPYLPIEFYEFNTEYGSMPYEIEFPSANNIRLAIDDNSNENSIQKMLDIWDKAYGDGNGNLIIEVGGIHNEFVVVKVIGFDLIEVVEQRKKIR